jgi:hypothetical protein
MNQTNRAAAMHQAIVAYPNDYYLQVDGGALFTVYTSSVRPHNPPWITWPRGYVWMHLFRDANGISRASLRIK